MHACTDCVDRQGHLCNASTPGNALGPGKQLNRRNIPARAHDRDWMKHLLQTAGNSWHKQGDQCQTLTYMCLPGRHKMPAPTYMRLAHTHGQLMSLQAQDTNHFLLPMFAWTTTCQITRQPNWGQTRRRFLGCKLRLLLHDGGVLQSRLQVCSTRV